MADGVNRLLNIDALKGFKHFRSFFRQTEPDTSYFIFSGRSIACFDSGSEHFQLETVSERSLKQMVPVLEKLGKNNSSRQWFFLWEPPWVLTFYERVIVLNREEIRAFALGRFLEGPKNSLEDEIETWDLEGPPVDESPHWVGAAYLEKNLHFTLGLLTAILDPKALEFNARCEKTFRRKIEYVPLIYPLLVTHTGPFRTISLFRRLAGASASTERVDAMADGVNRLLNIDALKGFKHFRSFFRQTEPDTSYFIFSGRSIACFDSGSEHFQLETVSERSLKQMVPVLEKLGKNNSSRQWFFLWEPPWVLTFYERVIVLNREEIRAFALGRFLEGPKNSLEDEIETWDLEGPPVDESPHWVGAAYLEKNLHSTLGLLTAILDPKAQEFHARCEKTFRRKIEHVPLIYPLLSKVEIRGTCSIFLRKVFSHLTPP